MVEVFVVIVVLQSKWCDVTVLKILPHNGEWVVDQ